MDDKEIEKRLTDLENRLARIENRFVIVPSSRTATSAGPSDKTPTTTTTTPFQVKPAGWLGIVAVICFISAAVFIIKLSIVTGWLTPERQIGLAYLLGFCLIAAGYVLLKKDREYASFLPATGVVILYFTTYGACQYYALFSSEVALIMTSFISVLCLGIYWRIRHDVYPIIAVSGTYLSTIFFGLDKVTTFSLYYIVVCSIAFAILSIWFKSRTLAVLSSYLSIFAIAWFGFNLAQDRLIAIILLALFLIFSLGTYLYSLRTKEVLTEQEAWNFLPVLLLFYAMEYYFIYQFAPVLVPWIAICFGIILIILYLATLALVNVTRLNSEPIIAVFVTIVFFHAVYLELLTPYARQWLLVIILLAVSLTSTQNYTQKNFDRFKFPMMAVILIAAIEYTRMHLNLFNQPLTFSLIAVTTWAFISLWIFILSHKELTTKNDDKSFIIFGATHLLAINELFQLTKDYNSLAVTASWLLYAVCVMALAYQRKDKVMAFSALSVLSFAAAKALLYDVAAAPTLIRILCLLLTGAVLYGAGFLLRRINEWKN